jgi:hypothetical protein
MSDTRAFLDYLALQSDVKPVGVGTTGYCMGGLMSLTAAGTYPERMSPPPLITADDSRPMHRRALTCSRRRSNHASILRVRLRIHHFRTI